MFQSFDPEILKSKLTAAGFVASDASGELVFERAHHKDASLRIVVYTTIPVKGAAIRGKGEDAIRVCLVFKDAARSRGVLSFPRVNRTGTGERVAERTLDRAREAYAAANETAKRGRCSCGAVRYADSGRCIFKCGVARAA